MRPLLCISGKRFSGKDTFAALMKKHEPRLALHAFAGESKRLFVEEQRALGVSVDLERLVSDRAYKEEWRPKLTAFTVDSIARDPLVFVRAVAGRVEASAAPALVTDMRLRLEIDYLRPRFALHVVRLKRSDEQRMLSGWRPAAVDGHHTETELDDPSLWNEIVVNDGTEAELEKKAIEIIRAQVK